MRATFHNILLSTTLLIATNSLAQKNALKANVLSAVASTINLSYERITKFPTDSSRVESLQLTGFYSNWSEKAPGLRGYGTVAEYRWYEKKSRYPTQPRGTYLSVYARYQHFNQLYVTYPPNAHSYFDAAGVGVLFGEQWVMASVIVLDVFVGTGYDIRSNTNWQETSTTNPLPKDLVDFPDWARMYDSHLIFRFGVRVGVKF